MSQTSTDAGKGRKKRQMPSSFTILFGCLLLVAVASWAVSLFTTDVRAATVADFMASPFLGFESAMQVCVFILVLGGFLGVVQKTGALDTGIAVLVRKLGGNDLLLVPVLMLAFGVCGSTYGMLEESVPFYLPLASVTFAMGWDPLVGCMVVLMGCGLGVLGSTVNPFSTGLALDALKAAGIAYDQGLMIGIGLVMFVIAEVTGIVFVMRYAKRVRADRASSALTPEEWQIAERIYGDRGIGSPEGAAPRLSKVQKRVLVLFALTFAVMIVGFIPWQTFGVTLFDIGGTADNPGAAWSAQLTGLPLGEWYFTECGIWFFTMTVVIGKVAGMHEKELVDTILHGCADLVSVALVVAVARGVSVLMSTTGLDVWILTNAANALAGVSATVFAPLSYALYFALSFLIPSSTGMATVSMPVMGPLAASLGFAPEAMIAVYLATHGVVAMITPTCGSIMAGLELAQVSYATYIKTAARYMALLTAITVVFVTVLMLVL